MPAWSAQLAAAFALSLLGGVHCAGMCGGFVGALHLRRPRTLAALPYAAAYHLGRVTAYTSAGALAGALGGTLFQARVLPLQIGLLVLAAAALGGVGLALLGSASGLKFLERLGTRGWRLLQPLAGRVLPPRSLPAAVLAGFLWGWIPCGMVYAALPLALLAGGALAGSAVLLAFGLGTLPNLLALELGWRGLGSSGAWPAARRWLRPAAGCAILLFAAGDLAHAARLAGGHGAALDLLSAICHSGA